MVYIMYILQQSYMHNNKEAAHFQVQMFCETIQVQHVLWYDHFKRNPH